ncbi:ricin-type beta-trefoil lectin domain protein [Streptomyces sp. TRM72054]|uniref:RICIN domain-containing protein n=1 Tax=Streptomyces sp. TRM72054 TaxID=2870562 RepID=UPI0027E1FD4A|nr:ricin-type beta-trefoil lectin domain protein [Streptomyces sp. TRM72054]
MQPPNPPRPPYPPRPGSRPGQSDRDLLARLADPEPDVRAVALLMARHWRPVYEYAVICLAASSVSASMAACAAFQQVLGRRMPVGALRPQLLMTVRNTVREWAAEDDVTALLPELAKPTGARGLRAVRSATPEKRRLAERAFHALPSASQCLLWHTEVETETITIPAGLLGIDALTASSALERAREEFRAGCVRAHRELAPTRECRFYNRLLDVPMRRGGALLPDVQRHLTQCGYCRHAAEQLSHFDGGLDVLLAETVLGWGAHRYLDSRPGRTAAPPPRPRPLAATRPRTGGRHRTATQTGFLTMPRRHARTLAAGVGLTSLALLATVLAARGWSDDNGAPGPGATWGAPSSRAVRPGPASEYPSAGAPSAASVERPAEVARGRLRNLSMGLCLDGRGGEVGLAACTTADSQQWSYQDDGQLRSVADPSLCLDADADADAGRVTLADCGAPSGQVQFDLTVRGELLLRWGKGRLVAPGTGGELVVAGRDGSAEQRWRMEAVHAETGEAGEPGETSPKSDDGQERDSRGGPSEERRGDSDRREGDGDRRGAGDDRRGAGDDRRGGDPDGDEQDRDGQEVPEDAPDVYEKRFAQVGCCDEQAEPAEPVAVPALEAGVHHLTGGIRDAVTSRGTEVAQSLLG